MGIESAECLKGQRILGVTSELSGRTVWITRVALALIIALGAGLRLYYFQNEAAWCDEVLSLRNMDQVGLGPFLAAVQKDNAPTVPLYFALEYAWAQYVSGAVESLRLLSILIGCLTIPSVYLVGKLLYGRTTGLLAALMLAAHSFHIYYSQEIRMYGLGWLWCVWSVYTLIKLLDTSKTRWWVLHGLLSLALLWTHLFNSFLLASEGLFLIYYLYRNGRWVRLAQWTAIQVASVSTLLIWSVLLANHDSITGSMAWVPPISMRAVQGMFAQYLGWADLPPEFSESTFALTLNATTQYGLAAAMILAYVYLLVRVAPRNAPRDTTHALTEREAFVLLSLWFSVPLVALALVAIFVEPAFISRYTGYCSMAFCLIVGAAVSQLRYRPMVVGAFALVAVLIGAQATFNVMRRPTRHSWDVAARCIRSAPEDQLVYINDPAAYVALSYYLARPISFVPDHSDIDDWQRILPFLSAQKRPGWMVFVSNYTGAMAEFEERLKERRLPFTKNIMPGGYRPLVVYHIVPDPMRR